MPTSLDARMRPTVKRLLDKFGMVAALEYASSLALDPATRGPAAGITRSEIAVRCSPPAPLTFRQQQASLTSTDTGSARTAVSTYTLIAAQGLTVTPAKGHVLRLATGERLAVVDVGALYSGDQIAAYEVYLGEAA